MWRITVDDPPGSAKKKPIGQVEGGKQGDATGEQAGPGESQHRLEPEDQEEPLEHAGAVEGQGADDVDQVVKGRPPLKELAQLGGDEQGDAEDQDEDYQPRDEITPG